MASETWRRARTWFGAVLAAAMLAAPAAHAQSAADKESARSLMQQGDDAVAAKDLAAALRAYESAHAIMNVPTTGLEVARTQAALGMLLEAQASAESVTRMAKVPGESPAFERARTDAARMVEELTRRVPSLQLEIVGPADPSRVEVRIDGNIVPPAARSAPVRVNPGKRVVLGTLAGHRDALVEVAVEERDRSTVRLRLDEAPAAVAPPPVASPAPPAAIDTVTPDAPRSSWSAQRTAALVVGGVGMVGIGVGVVFGLVAQSKNDDARTPANCPTTTQCYPQGKALLDDAGSAATVSTIAFAAGGAALAAGVVLFVTAPTRRAGATTSVRVVPGGASLRHTF